MPLRTVPFVNGEYYHIFNRGVAKLPTYYHSRDYQRFVTTLKYYRFSNLPCRLSRFIQLSQQIRQKLQISLDKQNIHTVSVVSYCLMPNHFHLLVRQEIDGGISNYVNQLTNSYTRYFNTKYNRSGHLYQGMFKAVHIEDDKQLVHVSRYIHLNPLVGCVVRESEFKTYQWSSLSEYFINKYELVTPHLVLDYFTSKHDYLAFVLDQADYAKQLATIKHKIFE